MSERDPLREALAASADAVRPFIVAPGVEAARRSARRRRARPVVAAFALLLAVIGIAAVVRPQVPPPSTEPSPSASASVSVSPTGSPAVTSSPSPAASPSPTLRGEAGAGSPAAPRSPKAAACVKRGYVWHTPVAGDGIRYKLSGVEAGQQYYRICPGETIRVFWAQYQYLPDGSQQLYASQSYTLTYAKPTVIATISVPAECQGSRFIVRGSESVKQTIAPGVTDVYRNAVSSAHMSPC